MQMIQSIICIWKLSITLKTACNQIYKYNKVLYMCNLYLQYRLLKLPECIVHYSMLLIVKNLYFLAMETDKRNYEKASLLAVAGLRYEWKI